MRRFKIIIATVVITLQLVVVVNAFAADKGRNKKMGYCFDVAFHEKTNRLYVAAGSMGTHVFEITKGKFNYITTVYEGSYHRNLKISGERIYVADEKKGLLVFDITEKIPVCTWVQAGKNVSGMGIYLLDNRIFLAAGGEGLHIFDVSEPDSPERIGTCKTNADAWDVWASDKFAYVADLQKGLTIVDVSQPSQPRLVSLVTWDQIEPMAEIVRGEGRMAYVAAGKHGLVVLDVSNPLNPQVLSKYKSGPGGFGEGLCVRNGLVYLSNGNQENKEENGLIIIDAQNPRSLKVKGKCTFPGWVEGVCLVGQHAFVTNTYSGIRSIDVSDPNNPRLVDSFGPIEEEQKKDPLLASETTPEEAQAIKEYRRIKARILDGENYNDSSTPLHAVLTRFSTWKPEGRGYFMGLDILRAPLPPSKPEEGCLWPVYAGDMELADTFILAYAKGRWIWIGNMGSNVDWRSIKPTFEKWARKEIEKITTTDGSSDQSATEAPKPDKSTVNHVLSLDGEEGYVRIADSQSLRSFSDTITIEVWLKVSSFYTEHKAINCIIRKNIMEGRENFFLRFRNVTGKPSVEMSIGYNHEALKVPYDFALDTWYHLAGTYDGSSMTVLANGLNIKSEKASGPLYVDKSDLFIGKGDPEFSLGEYFHGALDEFRIWNVARSPEEIRAAMNSPLTGKEEGLVVYLNFDDGTAKDLSGHGNDGLLNADARIVESPYPSILTPDEGKANRLVAWWKFDNDANDSAGTNHGSTHGDPTYVVGKFGRAINLDGDDYVDFGNPDSLNFGTGDWTVSAWIKTTQSGGADDPNRGTIFANGADEVGGIRIALILNDARLDMMTLTTDDDISNKVQATGTTQVNDGNWHHIVGMRNGSRLLLYIDGVLNERSVLYNGYDLSGVSQHNAYIGAITDNRDNSLYKHFDGLIDEVCVFACALDANSVSALYSGKDPVTVAEQAKVVTEPPSRTRQAIDDDTAKKIVGDWDATLEKLNRSFVITITRNTDGSIAANAFFEGPDGELTTLTFDEVTFAHGRLVLQAASIQAIFEGTMQDGGSTIEGQWQQQGQLLTLILKRAVKVEESKQTSREQSDDQISGKSNTATTLILILVLVGLIAVVVLFVVKSSIRS